VDERSNNLRLLLVENEYEYMVYLFHLDTGKYETQDVYHRYSGSLDKYDKKRYKAYFNFLEFVQGWIEEEEKDAQESSGEE